MTKTKKKLILWLSIIGTVALLVVLFVTLFSIKAINVEFVTEPVRTSAYQIEDIKNNSKIKKGKNIIFANTDKSIASLEEQFPYASFKIV